MRIILRRIKTYIEYKLRGEVPIAKLEKMGLKVGSNFNKMGGCIIDYSHCFLITIGDDVTLAPRVHILGHDASTKMFLGYTKIGRVDIGNKVFIGAGSIILPNVKVGNRVIIGAGSVVTDNIPDESVAVGNPARVICTINEYLERNERNINIGPVYDERWTIRGNVSDEMKKGMKDNLKSGIGYVE